MPDTSQTYAEEILERSRKDSGLDDSKFDQSPYDMYCAPQELYEKYKDDVLRLSLSFSRWVAPEDRSVLLDRVNQLNDTELGERLGIDEDLVRRIRCMAEWDLPMEAWRNAAEFKRRRRRELPAGCPDRDIRDEPS